MASQDIKSKRYNGIYYRDLSDGDRTYYALVTIDGKSKRFCLGKRSEGINEISAHHTRGDIISKARYGEEALESLPITLAKKKRKELLTFSLVAEKYISSRIISSATKLEYSTITRYLDADGFGLKSIASITISDVQSLQIKLKTEEKAASTVNKYIGFIKSVFNHGINNGIIKGGNPGKAVKNLKENNERQRYLLKDEIEVLLDTVRDNESLLLFCLVALQTGARLDSVLHLQVKDINFDNDSITIKNIKAHKTYTGFFAGELKDVLNTRFKSSVNPNDFLISFNGKKTTDRQIQCRLKPLLDKLFNQGLDAKDSKNRVVIHTFRHTLATHLAIKGAPIHEIMKIMDHANIAETMRYAKFAPDCGKSSIQQLYGS